MNIIIGGYQLIVESSTSNCELWTSRRARQIVDRLSLADSEKPSTRDVLEKTFGIIEKIAAAEGDEELNETLENLKVRAIAANGEIDAFALGKISHPKAIRRFFVAIGAFFKAMMAAITEIFRGHFDYERPTAAFSRIFRPSDFPMDLRNGKIFQNCREKWEELAEKFEAMMTQMNDNSDEAPINAAPSSPELLKSFENSLLERTPSSLGTTILHSKPAAENRLQLRKLQQSAKNHWEVCGFSGILGDFSAGADSILHSLSSIHGKIIPQSNVWRFCDDIGVRFAFMLRSASGANVLFLVSVLTSKGNPYPQMTPSVDEFFYRGVNVDAVEMIRPVLNGFLKNLTDLKMMTEFCPAESVLANHPKLDFTGKIAFPAVFSVTFFGSFLDVNKLIKKVMSSALIDRANETLKIAAAPIALYEKAIEILGNDASDGPIPVDAQRGIFALEQIAAPQREIAPLEGITANLRGDIVDLKETAATHKRQFTVLNAETIARRNSGIEGLKRQIGVLEDRISTIRDEIAALNLKVNGVEGRLMGLFQEFGEMDEEMSFPLEGVELLIEQVKTRFPQCPRLEMRDGRLRTLCEQLQAADEDGAVTTLSERWCALNERVKILRNKSFAFEDKVRSLGVTSDFISIEAHRAMNKLMRVRDSIKLTSDILRSKNEARKKMGVNLCDMLGRNPAVKMVVDLARSVSAAMTECKALLEKNQAFIEPMRDLRDRNNWTKSSGLPAEIRNIEEKLNSIRFITAVNLRALSQN